ncbi:hypothetical protein MLD38_009495 [Melastoma candidum]|uniref:Uncharacterized protein n=1 Tax=Melastoma candidum TaxID=119954 RepID=A0ACB9S231_9MYRT|nr:hypothetical protein MLD38_009495 [Melastoma candidum]
MLSALGSGGCPKPPPRPAYGSAAALDRQWNLLIKHHAKLKDDRSILAAYTHMRSLGISPDNAALPLVLKACSRLKEVELGEVVHSSVSGTAMIEDLRIATALIDFYCKCGKVGNARLLFDGMRERDVVAWNAMAHGYVDAGEHGEAMSLLMRMGTEGVRMNSRTLVALLLACRELLELRIGLAAHCYCLRHGMLDEFPQVMTALIGFYSSFDEDASRIVFDMMTVQNAACFNALLSAYFEVGSYEKALEIFLLHFCSGGMIDLITMLVVIQVSMEIRCVALGMQFHQMVLKSGFSNDLRVANALLTMYGQLRIVESADGVFWLVSKPDVALWNSLLLAYSESGFAEKAHSLFLRMQAQGVTINERTISIMLYLCEDLPDGLRLGKSLHAYVAKIGMRIDTSLGNALLNMYAEMDSAETVKRSFMDLEETDVVSWNVLISALAKEHKIKAWEIFVEMLISEVKPNPHSLISILSCCVDESSLSIGRSIHGYAIKHGFEVDQPLNTALTEMYMNCGDEAGSETLFNCCSNKDVISWNSMIVNYIRNNQTHKALLLFQRMVLEVEPNSSTLVNILSSCIYLADLPLGQCIHAYVTRREPSLGSDLPLANSLIAMYSKCGSLKDAERIFETLERKDIISWNSLITGYGMHGRAEDAIATFKRMLEEDTRPNEVTFVSILSACSHSRLIEDGLQIFYSMHLHFKINPELIHYGCVVDLLGRGGYLDEALNFINSMPIEADASIWRAFLSACHVHMETKLVKIAFRKLIELEPLNEGNYVMLSNIYAAAGLWSEVQNVRTMLWEKGLRKPPGISWIVLKNQTHVFLAGDRSHPESDVIYETLRYLTCSIREVGYVPDNRWEVYEFE